jgi:DNA-binding transcriptional LysR family regulator
VDPTLPMLAFVRAIERGGFTPAARELGVTPSAVSKLITRLEHRLGVRLLHRSTRRLSLTAEGAVYLERVQRIVGEIADAESEVMRFGVRPRGRVRMILGTAFATYALVPALPEFVERYPEITLDLIVGDRNVGLLEAGADLEIRVGPLGEANLVARRIADLERVISAAPSYLAKRGMPRTPEDLAHHNCLTLAGIPGQAEWPFRDAGGVRSVAVKGGITVNNAETLFELALLGVGVIRLSDIIVGPAIRSGRLVPLLTDVHQPEPLPLHAVYLPNRYRPPKVGVVIDFLVEKFGNVPWRLPHPVAVATRRAASRPGNAKQGNALASAKPGRGSET